MYATVPGDAIATDVVYVIFGWNGYSNIKTMAAEPSGLTLIATTSNPTGSTSQNYCYAYGATGTALANQSFFGMLSATPTSSCAWWSLAIVVKDAALTPAAISTSSYGSTLISSATVYPATPSSSDQLGLLIYHGNTGSSGNSATSAPVYFYTDSTTIAGGYVPSPNSSAYGNGYLLVTPPDTANAHVVYGANASGVGRTFRGGSSIVLNIASVGKTVTGQGRITTSATTKATRGKKGLTATRKGSFTALALARATKGTVRIVIGRGTLTFSALAAARRGSALQTGYGRLRLITTAATAAQAGTAALAITGQGHLTGTGQTTGSGTTQRFGTAHQNAEATITGVTAIGQHLSAGQLTATALTRATAGTSTVIPLDTTGYAQLIFSVDTEAGLATTQRTGTGGTITASVTFSNTSWAYDPDDHNKFYGQAADITALAIIENITGQKSITFDVDLDPLSSTAAFTQKGATVQGGQGLLPVGTVLAQNQDGKYVVVSLEDTDSNAVILRTAIDATNEDVLATVIISGTVRLDLLSTEDIEKLDPLGAKVSTGKGTARI